MAVNGVVSRRWRSEGDLPLPCISKEEVAEVHVLAVDDSLVDRKVIERLLKITSCKVTAVDSGIRALQFLGLGQDQGSSTTTITTTTSSDSAGFNYGLKVDMIITDYCMPGMTGYELLKKVKESSALREIPVVIMSSENVVTRIDRCLEEGAEDFIVKPVKLSDVKRLRDYMVTREVRVNKRKISDACCDLVGDSSSSPPITTTASTHSSSPSPSPSASPVSRMDSPTRRVKLASSSD